MLLNIGASTVALGLQVHAPKKQENSQQFSGKARFSSNRALAKVFARKIVVLEQHFVAILS